MRVASVSEAKNSLSALLDHVKSGESVLIVDRGLPVARIEPLRGRDDGHARRARLERTGTVRRGAGGARAALAGVPPAVSAGHGTAAVDALVEERGTGR